MKRVLIILFLLLFLILPVAADYIEYPYFNATASGYFASQYPWNTIDHNILTYWDGFSFTPPGYLRIDYGSGTAHTINNYSYYVVGTTITSWNFEGSNDAATWNLLDNRSVAISGPAWKNYSVTKTANISAYQYYQTRILSVAHDEPTIYEFSLRYYEIEDATPPYSITNLLNDTGKCEEIKWTWTNPTNTDYSHLYTLKNNVFMGNYTNSTTTVNWTGLTGLTTFSSKTVDLFGNMNATWVNGTATATPCPTPTPTPTPTTTTTGGGYTFSTGCSFYNLTNTTQGFNATNWAAQSGLVTWGVMETNHTHGNVSWWVCIATETTPVTPGWQPNINPTTDTHKNWWIHFLEWWWLPLLILVMMILFNDRR